MTASTAASPRRATIHDVASLAGVSHQTVSRVLNDHPSVRTHTRRRVRDAMDSLSYAPSLAARQLVSGRSTVIGVLAIGTHHSGPRQMVSNLELTARGRGYGVALVDVPTVDASDIRHGMAALTAHQVAGVIVLSPVEMPSTMLEDLTRTTPVVLVDAESKTGLPFTTIDQYTGARLAAQHLVDLGHRRLALLNGPGEWHDAQLRRKGWRSALSDAGLQPVAERTGDWSAASGHAAVESLLAEGVRPGIDATGLLCANDAMALGALSALHHSGVDVPGTVSVVGFDDSDESGFFLPPLTTVRQDFHSLGRQCVEQLVQLLEHPDDAVRVQMIPATLVVRSSTTALAPEHSS